MAELFEGREEPGTKSSSASQTDGTAVAIALDRARRRKGKAAAGADEVDRFLEKQEALIDKQVLHLDEQLHHMRLKHFDQRLSVMLKLLTVAAGVMVALGLAWMAFDASRDNGLVIRPFSVPPALAQRGVTGEAIAAQLIDRWGAMADLASSSEAQKSVSTKSAEGPSIEIPETGVSISQVEQWLKDKLGHERRITGEVMQAADGTLVLTVRDGALAMPEQTGSQADLPAMLQKAAESLYRQEQPISYGGYLQHQGREADMVALDNSWIERGDRLMKAIAYANRASVQSDPNAARADYERSIAIDPKAASTAYSNQANFEGVLGHVQRAYELRARALTLFPDRKAFPTLTKETRAQRVLNTTMGQAGVVGDYAAVLAGAQRMADQTLLGFSSNTNTFDLKTATALTDLHDIAAARALLARAEHKDSLAQLNWISAAYEVENQMGDWPRAWALLQEAEPLTGTLRPWQTTGLTESAANVLIHLGRLDEADAELDLLLPDNVRAVELRAELAEAKGDRAGADRLFRLAADLALVSPAASEAWGRTLLARRDFDGAIRQFQIANARGPKWADPLEGWGEALLAQGDGKGAAKQFAAAQTLAPKWGRLHMKWAQALAGLGKAEEARAQLKVAAGLELTPDEKAELARVKV